MRGRTLVVSAALWGLAPLAAAQDLEPRRWTHLPLGLEVVGVSYGYTEGDLFLDPVLAVEDASVEAHTAVLSYSRSFELAGRSARIDALLPYQESRWAGLLDGVPASTRRDGFGDPRLRLSMNLIGAPPLRGKAFADHVRAHPVHTTLGAALAVTLPLGEYKEELRLNLGQNRFSIRPQLGVLHTRGPWSFELTGSVYFYTDNDDFLVDRELQRDPVYALQAHVVRTLAPGWWVAGGAGYGWGGESEVDGRNLDDAIGNLLAGASFGVPLTRNQGLKLAWVRGSTQVDVGQDTDSFLIGWSMHF